MYQTFTHVGFNSRVWSYGQPIRIGDTQPELFLKSYGRVTCDGHFRLEQVHDMMAFHLFEDGAGVFELDGRRCEVEAGNMVVVRPGVHARYHDRPDRPWRYRWFTLDGARSAALASETGLGEKKALFEGSWSERFVDLFTRIEAGYAGDSASPYLAVALGWAALTILSDACQNSATAVEDSLVGRAQFIIQQDYYSGLQVEDLARRLGVSRATLFRKFRDEVGLSPKAYLDDLRLAQARELLRRGTSTVKEVAYACGFSNPHYFSRAYRKRYGESPSSTRNGSGGQTFNERS